MVALGKSIPSTPGQTIMDAALVTGVYIPPTSLSQPETRPHGSCRVCVVRAVGCKLPLADGSVLGRMIGSRPATYAAWHS